ncbi:MAG: hypothetical protein ACRERD_20070 [Candidatus Binatia bacterium]
MDGSRFDSWTRRGFGLAAGGLVASVLGVAGLTDADAKKKRKKRCKKVTQRCKLGGKKKRCCHGLRCDRVEDAAGRHCCRKTQAACASDNECCLYHVCDEIFAGSGNRCCIKLPTPLAPTAPCQVDDDCCGLAVCNNGFCD